MSETLVPLDLGIWPEAAVSGALLLQSEYSTFLLFNATRPNGDYFSPAGTAVVEINGCMITKFGYPNDEAWSSIPRTTGLVYGIYEVQGSDWEDELVRLNRNGFPETKAFGLRHFLFLFHDSSFECLARDLSLALSLEPLRKILAQLSERIATE